MRKIKFQETLKYILVIGAGFLAFWQLSLFRPYSANYPPSASYQVVTTRNHEPDTILAAPGAHYAQNRLGEFFLGKHYRFFWETPIKAPVLDLKREAGGLYISKRGGGMQTTSFTLLDKDSIAYSLRSVDKDPISVIPTFLWPSIFGCFIRDQVAATDPFALRPVLYLTSLAGIAQTEAKLVFVRKDDPAFQKFKLPGNGFYYLSKKPEVPRADAKNKELGGRFYATDDMLLSLKRNPTFSIDTTTFLKCRLFDLYIGDWDRHAGQWDWLGFKAQNDTVFKPIPKDRDQAFGYYSDGFFPYLLSRNFAVRKITSFTPEFNDIPGFSQNGSDLDSRFLKPLSEEKFSEMAMELQRVIPIKELEEASRLYPQPVQALAAKQLLPTLISRRKNLPKAAREYAQIIKKRTN